MNNPFALVIRGLTLSTLALVVACGGDSQPASNDTASVEDTAVSDDVADDALEADSTVAEDTTVGEDTAVAEDTAAALCEYAEPSCADEQIAALRFSDVASGGAIVEEGTVAGEFTSNVDATAGGFNGDLGYTYARFTETGLEAVDISDEESLDSMDWDIAFRRYIIRLNSGVSGPSCVLGGRTAPTTTWDELTTEPKDITYHEEQYYIGEACEYVAEPSGIGSPQTVLSSFWTYPGCVAMTGNIYVIALRDGRRVKATVLSYYSASAQKTCNDTGAAPQPNGSGHIRMRWAFLD
ncbi:MAG: hypothetical protein EP329_08165 [Deltaproteobacteria bacterium]|nr:MAG: hypothetical protein EP329_08165 [Deltaproteobacteria bacterium]